MAFQLFQSMLEDNGQLGKHANQKQDRQIWKKTCCYFMSKSTPRVGELSGLFRHEMNCGRRASKLISWICARTLIKHFIVPCTGWRI